MGAKARAWVNRGLLGLAVVTGVVLVLWFPGLSMWASTWAKAGILALAALVGGFVAFREIPAFDPMGRIHWRLPRRLGRACAITFDDGPSENTLRLLEILARYQVKATFFVLSANARRHPDVIRAAAAAGHTIAIHGTSHQKVHRAGEADIERELATAIRELSELGVPPARLYRTPHGLKNRATFRVAHKFDCQLWAWSRGIWDTDRPAPAVLVKRALRFARARMVLLLHDGRGDEEHPDIEPMLAALPRIIEGLAAAGFTFLTLDQA